MKLILSILLALVCSLLVSCTKWGNSENNRLIQQAQSLVELAPDSALTLLDRVNTTSLNDVKWAEYTLLRVQARANAGLDLSTDTEIFQAQEYFTRRKDPEKAALACFFAAKAVEGKDKADEQMKSYQEALNHVQYTDNKLLHGKILYNMGYMNYNRCWYAEAISCYRQAMRMFQTAGGQYHREIYALNAIANSFLLNAQNDSAQYYFKTALNQAKLNENPAMQFIVYNNMGVTYREKGQMDTANYYGRRA
jgi:tetratricopeptide (TPR) repeat protein